MCTTACSRKPMTGCAIAATLPALGGARRAASLCATRLEGAPARGDSVEAGARERYARCAAMALEHGATAAAGAASPTTRPKPCCCKRCAAPAPPVWPRCRARRARRHRLGAALARRAAAGDRRATCAPSLDFVDDDSNGEPRFARNRLRLDVWPALSAAFPDAEVALAARRHAARRARRWPNWRRWTSRRAGPDGLRLEAWRRCPRRAIQRAARLARRMRGRRRRRRRSCSACCARPPACGTACWPLAAGELRRHRGRLCFVAHASIAHGAAEPPAALDLAHAGVHRLPGWPGCIEVTRRSDRTASRRAAGRGAARSRAAAARRFKPGPGRPSRALKKQYQAFDIPAWQRDGRSLYNGERLLFVAGLGCDARAWAATGEPRATCAGCPMPGAAAR